MRSSWGFYTFFTLENPLNHDFYFKINYYGDGIHEMGVYLPIYMNIKILPEQKVIYIDYISVFISLGKVIKVEKKNSLNNWIKKIKKSQGKENLIKNTWWT